MSGMGVRVVERPDGPTVHTVVESGMGPVTLIGVGEVLTGLLLPSTRERNVTAPGEHGPRDDTALTVARAQLTEYLAGERHAFDLDVALQGSAFQVRVWEGLLRIPYGETWSYGELAADIGYDPRTSSRAVGAANGANRIAVVVPCHRVIGANGTLTGFAAGVERKRFLLDLERPPVPADATLF
ncbi:methylated-DNA--[protein]-cysteine S-methyltransferase [Cellulomonas fimi]|uniref:methylated-DNA--[protein]-cysteine S-methyltransferase n=1 Tax=Cellulomonas fimi TaxID=1708 RepID=UPI00235A161E|nr:methylated-DNA--[protein]-cysteine S-methyltransferase [Cellulomonas fimi]